jgi:hypothetical protein
MDAHFDGFENRSLPLYNRTNKFKQNTMLLKAWIEISAVGPRNRINHRENQIFSSIFREI